jgi:hypothetical protein
MVLPQRWYHDAAVWAVLLSGNPLHELAVCFERIFPIQSDRSSLFSFWAGANTTRQDYQTRSGYRTHCSYFSLPPL